MRHVGDGAVAAERAVKSSERSKANERRALIVLCYPPLAIVGALASCDSRAAYRQQHAAEHTSSVITNCVVIDNNTRLERSRKRGKTQTSRTYNASSM